MNSSLVRLVFLATVLAPSPAFAWFGWLDKFSGPGPFLGLLFDVRVACFGDKYDGPPRSQTVAAEESAALLQSRAESDYARANSNQGTAEALLLYRAAAESYKAASDRWDDAHQHWRATALAWAALVDADSLWDSLGLSKLPAAPVMDQTVPKASDDQSGELKVLKLIIDAYKARITATQKAVADVKKDIDGNKRQNAFALSSGVFYSGCTNDVGRRASIDLGIGLWRVFWGDDKADKLATGRIAFVIKIASWLDYSTGASLFALTSSRYDTVRGVLLDPARLQFHVPYKASRETLSRFVFSWGPTVVPSGFGANAFGNPERIGREIIWNSYTIHYNLSPGLTLK